MLRIDDVFNAPDWANALPPDLQAQLGMPSDGNAEWNWNPLNDMNPNAGALENMWGLTKGLAAAEGFDLGLFGALNPGGGMLGNAFGTMKWLSNNESGSWAGDLTFDADLGNLLSQVGPVTENMGFATGDLADALGDLAQSAQGLWQGVGQGISGTLAGIQSWADDTFGYADLSDLSARLDVMEQDITSWQSILDKLEPQSADVQGMLPWLTDAPLESATQTGLGSMGMGVDSSVIPEAAEVGTPGAPAAMVGDEIKSLALESTGAGIESAGAEAIGDIAGDLAIGAATEEGLSAVIALIAA